MPMTKHASLDLSQTEQIAKDFVSRLFDYSKSNAFVLALSGELGAGKTTFVQFVAKALGITEQITSPTFVIEKIYKIEHPVFERMIHVDAYRLESEGELKNLGWEEIVSNPKNLILIEWPERAQELIPEDAHTAKFKVVGDKRDIDI